MRKGELPYDLDEDTNSGYQLSSDGLIIKDIVRRFGSRTSSKDQGKYQTAKKVRSKKPKCKADTKREKLPRRAKAKKRRRLRKAHTTEGETEKERERETVDADVETMEQYADEQQVVGKENEVSEGNERIDLTEAGNEPPPHQPLPFVPFPSSHTTVKDTDQGVGHPLIASSLIDSIILPANATEYLKHSERALLNHLTELTYEVNYFYAQLYHCNSLYLLLYLSCQANVI